MDFMRSLVVAASGLKAQSGRMRVIAENIANADSTASTPGGDPYRRKLPTFKSELDRELGVKTVELGRVREDSSAFPTRYDPGNPAAGPDGYVKLPNVQPLVEQMDLREAQRTYEANIGVVTATRQMISRTLQILRV